MHQENTTDKIDKILSQIEKGKRDSEIIDVDEKKIKLVIFTAGKNLYAFYGSGIKEILPFDKINYVPGCPEIISGIINVRGDIESVIDTHVLLGEKKPNATERSRIILASAGGVTSGFFVDSVEDVIDIPESDIAPPVSTIEEPIRLFISGETVFNGHYTSVLDIEKIFRTIAE